MRHYIANYTRDYSPTEYKQQSMMARERATAFQSCMTIDGE